jgi:hypothetical protein
MKLTPKILYPGVALLVVLGFVIYRIVFGSGAKDIVRQNVSLVRVEQARRETVTYKLQFTGDMLALSQANIFSKVTGNLERVFVDMGTRVQRDQLLALIDTTELHQQYQQAAATYENARTNYVRTRDLSEQNLVAKQEADNADATMKVAKANYETAATRLGYGTVCWIHNAAIPRPWSACHTRCDDSIHSDGSRSDESDREHIGKGYSAYHSGEESCRHGGCISRQRVFRNYRSH